MRPYLTVDDVHWIPGRFFPQNEDALRHIPRIYERNERAVLRLLCGGRELLLVLVGASLVGGIHLRGVPRPAWARRDPVSLDRRLDRGEELAHFTFGSTRRPPPAAGADRTAALRPRRRRADGRDAAPAAPLRDFGASIESMTPWTEEALAEEVLVCPRRAFVPLPDTQIDERPGWMPARHPLAAAGGAQRGLALRPLRRGGRRGHRPDPGPVPRPGAALPLAGGAGEQARRPGGAARAPRPAPRGGAGHVPGHRGAPAGPP